MHFRQRSFVRWALLVTIGQLAVRALIGGGALIVDPSGAVVGLSRATLEGTPFSDFLVPGLVLAGALGLYPTFVCYGLYKRRTWAWMGAVSVAVVLAVWLAVQLAVGYDRPTTYLNVLTAGVILVLAVHPSVRRPDEPTPKDAI